MMCCVPELCTGSSTETLHITPSPTSLILSGVLFLHRLHISLRAVFRSNLLSNLRAANLSASMYAFSLAISAFISAGSLLLWHAYLVYTNQVENSIFFYADPALTFVIFY